VPHPHKRTQSRSESHGCPALSADGRAHSASEYDESSLACSASGSDATASILADHVADEDVVAFALMVSNPDVHVSRSELTDV
jgi:hypothetical protein